MPQGLQPENEKLPPEKRAKNRKNRGGQKGTPPRAVPPAPKKMPPTPLLIAWVLAVIILSSLIYFSRESRQLPQQTPDHSVSDTINDPKFQDSKVDVAQEKTSENSENPRESVPLAMNRPTPTPKPTVPPPDIVPKLAKISIVIDDFGPDLEMAKQFASLPFPITFSVLPHQAHSREIAELAHTKGKEVILHLPMEPLDSRENPGRGALLLSMSSAEILRNVSKALDTSPYFDGANNHMGSRFTQNEEMMKIVLADLKGRNIFFLDSMTTNDSKGWKVAREFKMPTRKRDVFLDDDPSHEAIRSQIVKLISKAKAQGTALAIGHPRKTTLKSLQESAGQFRKEGMDIVPARELMSR